MKEIVVKESESGQRIDKFIKKYLNGAPLSFIYKLFRKKDIKVNGHWVKIDYITKPKDIINIYIKDEQIDEFSKPKEVIKNDFKYEIIYEDNNILIINKPRGLLVHGDNKEKRVTLTNEVLNYLYFKGEYNPNIDKAFTPAPAHRLDRNTSGLVVYGKSLSALTNLEELFKNKTEISKKYQALVIGAFPNDMVIDLPLLKDAESGIVKVTSKKNGGQDAISVVTLIQKFLNYSLVEIELITGRTHQIRVHLSAKGYPLVGDSKYGNFKENKIFKKEYGFENQFLHAYSLEFRNVNGVLSYLKNRKFIAEMPQNEKEILKKLSNI